MAEEQVIPHGRTLPRDVPLILSILASAWICYALGTPDPLHLPAEAAPLDHDLAQVTPLFTDLVLALNWILRVLYPASKHRHMLAN